jgi:hypothetical protein
LARSATRHRFDVIVFARPDLVWWQPLPAWCTWPISERMLSCDKPGCDMAWVAPRMHMERLLSQAEMHRDCTDTGPAPHGAGRPKINVREIAHCCATSEWLLWYAQSARAAAAAAAAHGRGSGGSGGNGGNGGYSSDRGEIPVRRSGALEPDNGHYTVLREASHACERSLSRSYAEDKAHQLKLQAKHGLSVATGRRLRRLFGTGNVSECRRALEPP